MKKIYFLLLAICISHSGWAQDTIYLNSSYKNVDQKDQATYFRIINVDNKVINAKTYDISGLIKQEANYMLKGNKKIYEGLQKHWYKDGALHIQSEYKKGKRNGKFISYWKSGKLKREDIYKNGTFKRGACFDENGKEVTYYDFEINPQFPGGRDELINYLKSAIKPEMGQGKVVVQFKVEKDGSIQNAKVVKSDNPALNEYCLTVVNKMPRWSPGFQDGQPVSVIRTLPLVISN